MVHRRRMVACDIICSSVPPLQGIEKRRSLLRTLACKKSSAVSAAEDSRVIYSVAAAPPFEDRLFGLAAAKIGVARNNCQRTRRRFLAILTNFIFLHDSFIRHQSICS